MGLELLKRSEGADHDPHLAWELRMAVEGALLRAGGRVVNAPWFMQQIAVLGVGERLLKIAMSLRPVIVAPTPIVN